MLSFHEMLSVFRIEADLSVSVLVPVFSDEIFLFPHEENESAMRATNGSAPFRQEILMLFMCL